MDKDRVQDKSLYAEYIKAREDFDCLEKTFGFATYKISGDDCYIRDIYVIPEMRNQGGARLICDEIRDFANRSGCKNLIGTVQPSTKGATTSMRAILAYGFEVFSSQNDFIVFKLSL